MTKANAIKIIFQKFLYFLTEKAVNILLDHCSLEKDGGKIANRIIRILDTSAHELMEFVKQEGDEEDIVEYLNVFLWKQKCGKIRKDLRIEYDFEEQENAWLIHRFMIANGYKGIDTIPFRLSSENIITTYATEIEKYLGFFKKDGGYYDDDDDYFSYLATNLNVIGPKIKNYKRLSDVKEFVDYIITHFKEDNRLKWLSPAAFTMLVYDLTYPKEKTWPIYQSLINMNHDIFDYVAWLLGIQMYGDLLRKDLQKIEIIGGYDLLDALASN